MGEQLRVKPTSSPTLPAVYTYTGTDGNSQTAVINRGTPGKAFDPRVNEHGDQWVMVNGVVQLAGRGPSGQAIPLAANGLGILGVALTDQAGVAWGTQYNSIASTFLVSSAYTTTQTSVDIPTYNLKYLKVIVDTTVFGTGSVTLTINSKDPASGKYILLLSGAAIVSVVTNTYNVGPTLVAAANVTATAQLGNIIQLVTTANNANPQTYSVGYVLS